MKVTRVFLTMLAMLGCAPSYAQSNAATTEPAPVTIPACPTLPEGIDDAIKAALDQYCASVAAAWKVAVDRAVVAAAAATERDVQPQLAAARAAHRSCTLEGAILGAGLTFATTLLLHGTE